MPEILLIHVGPGQEPPGWPTSYGGTSCGKPSETGRAEVLEATGGFEPPHKGFADLSLNHLGTSPSAEHSNAAGKGLQRGLAIGPRSFGSGPSRRPGPSRPERPLSGVSWWHWRAGAG